MEDESRKLKDEVEKKKKTNQGAGSGRWSTDPVVASQ